MKASQNGFVGALLLVIIAFLLVGGGAYVYMQMKQGNPPVIENSVTRATSTQQITNAATSTIHTSNSQTDNWVTYKDTDNRNNFTFDFPAAWRLDVVPDYSLQIFSSSTDTGATAYDNNEIVVEIGKGATNNTQEVREWCEQSVNHQEWGPIFTNTHYLIVGGEKAYLLDYNYQEVPGFSDRRICIARGRDKYTLEGHPLDSIFMPIFDKVVNTFQFTK